MFLLQTLSISCWWESTVHFEPIMNTIRNADCWSHRQQDGLLLVGPVLCFYDIQGEHLHNATVPSEALSTQAFFR